MSKEVSLYETALLNNLYYTCYRMLTYLCIQSMVSQAASQVGLLAIIPALYSANRTQTQNSVWRVSVTKRATL